MDGRQGGLLRQHPVLAGGTKGFRGQLWEHLGFPSPELHEPFLTNILRWQFFYLGLIPTEMSPERGSAPEGSEIYCREKRASTYVPFQCQNTIRQRFDVQVIYEAVSAV